MRITKTESAFSKLLLAAISATVGSKIVAPNVFGMLAVVFAVGLLGAVLNREN